MRHVAPLFPVRSVDSTYFPAPRGCTYPASILIQDFAVSVSQCLCGKSHVLRNLQPLCLLFALFSALPSFVFKSLQPLFAKHPGGVAATFLGRPSLRHSPLSGRLQRLFGLQYTLRPGSWQHRRIYTPPWINASPLLTPPSPNSPTAPPSWSAASASAASPST